MPTCGSCGTQWPDGSVKCAKDGTSLVSGIDLTQMTSSAALAARAVDPSDQLVPGSTAGEYEIVQKIGEGGMGSVYGARHPVIGKRAAIKVIHRQLSASVEAVDRFIREAQAVNQIGHPNIVDVFGFGQLNDGRRFFVMEWLQGEPLSQRIKRALSFDEAIEILEDVAKALEAAHDAGVMHRDLKPDNVFLQDRKGERHVVKLLDFGLAKLTVGPEGGLEHTRTGVVMGTPLYLSPEQAKGTRVDFPTDIYSLGAMAYEMFSGQVPFKADSAVETMALHISQPPLPLRKVRPELPLAVEQLVCSMLEKNPQKRPSIAQVRADLGALRDPAAIRSRDSRPASVLANAMIRSDMALATTTATGQVPKTRRIPVPVIYGVVAAIAAAITFGVFMIGRDSTPAPVAAKTTPPPRDPDHPVPPVAVAIPPPPMSPRTDPHVPTPEMITPPKTVKPAVRLGTVVITIQSTAYAQIFVDDKVVGTGVATVTHAVPPGAHRVKVIAKGYKPAVAKVRVIAGRTHDVRLDLQKLKPSVNAVHDPFDE